MTFALILLLLVLSLGTLARTVRRDGLGQRPAPRSHRAWDDAPTS